MVIFLRLFVSDSWNTQRLSLQFFGQFTLLLVLSAPFSLLFGTLIPTESECSRAVCGLIWGQRALLDQVRHNWRRLFRRALFHVQVWGIVPLPGVLSKSFLCGKRISFSHAYTKNKGRRPSPICSTATECPQWSVRSSGRSDFRDSAGTPCRCPCSGKRSGSPLYFPELFSKPDSVICHEP